VSTPRLNSIHIRLSSAVRDSISTPSENGKELSFLDRKGYIQSAWENYVNLFYKTYASDSSLLRKGLQDLVSFDTEIDVNNPQFLDNINYGYCLSINSANIQNISRVSPEEFLLIKSGKISTKVASASNVYYTTLGSAIFTVPSDTLNADMLYIKKAFELLIEVSDPYFAGVELPLDESHHDSILCLALSKYYNDKQDYSLRESYLNQAILVAPFPLINPSQSKQ